MKYSSPFHLLPEHDVSALEPNDLKRWKRELLLQFDLQKSTTISVKEKEYDKNSILQAFDSLKDMPEYHWRLYQNKPLLEFIEEEYIDFFEHKENWIDFEDIPYRDWLGKWFIPEYDDMILQIAVTEDADTQETLETLGKSDFRLPQEWKYQAFTKTNRFFRNLIRRGEAALENGLIEKGKRVKFSSEVHQYINIDYLDVLNIIPDNGIRQGYGDFSNEVIARVLYKERRFRHIEKESLRTLAKAAEINIAVNDDSHSKVLLRQIVEYQGEGMFSENKGCIFWVIFMIVKALLLLSLS